MIYNTAQDWRDAPYKRVLLFAMSGLGKTYVSQMLRDSGDWFHYSVDYRIGTRYMGEYIADNAKVEAMKNPFLRELLRSDSIYIGSNLSFENLKPVASYLGKPGDPSKDGLSMDEYIHRQNQFRQAEIYALRDTEYFIHRAQRLYDYPHFICDTGGSICEWVDAENPDDPILKALSQHTLLVWIKGDEGHTQTLVRRFDAAPKPMAYESEFLAHRWQKYLNENNCKEADVDPDHFIRWTYAQALAHRQPRYEAMAKWGITVTANDIAHATNPEGFIDLIAHALEMRQQ